MNEHNFSFPTGRYLITGAAGFIGSHLCGLLLSKGCEVVGVDNFITGNKENLHSYAKDGKFSFIEQDIVLPFQFEKELNGIFHLASPASPVDYLNFPIETLHVGAMGSDRMLQLAKQKSCPILIASTSEVYGDPLEHPQRESYWGNVNPIGPRSCYDESKRYMEALTMAYHRKYGLKTRIVRIFNTYGPRMKSDDGRVVPNFFMQALMNKDITIYGDGKQTRSFCYVDDLIEGFLRVFTCEHVEPINLGNPNELTIAEFAEIVLRLAHSKSRLVFRELPQDDPKTRRPVIEKAHKLLSWEPKVRLEEGLIKTCEYFKNRV